MKRRRGFGLASTDLPLLLFLASAGLAVWPAHNRDACWPTLAAIASGVGVYFVISRTARGRAAVAGARRSAAWWRASSLSAYFVSQYSHLGYGEKLPYLDQAAAWFGAASPRLGGWAPDRNSVATALEGVVFLAVGLAAAARSRASARRVERGRIRPRRGPRAVGLTRRLARRGGGIGRLAGHPAAVDPARPAATALIVAAPLLVGLAWLAWRSSGGPR